MRVCVAAIALFTSSPALAAPPGGPPVHMLVRECDGVVETEVERVLAADLGAETGADDQAQDPTWIVARCVGNRVIIEVSDGISRKTLRRSFDLGAAPVSTRGRLIAVAASELVLAGWAELALRPKLRVEPEGDPPSESRVRAAVERAQQARIATSTEQWPSEPQPEAAPAASQASEPREARDHSERRGNWFSLQPPERRMFRVMPLASLRSFIGHDGALWGGGLRFGEERLVSTGWAIDALVESGRIDAFHIDNYTIGGELYLYVSSRYAALRGGAGLRAGLATSSPSAPSESMPLQEATRTPAPWGWPMLAVSATLGQKGGPVLEVSGEAGYVALPVTSGRYGESIRGPWFALQAGVGFAP
ncbi:MAG TPA: hypothetical protein VG937_28550 [Polyangiaceae bacterium]|nr:hypothetical protein [Polyangiaceae bacterium]